MTTTPVLQEPLDKTPEPLVCGDSSVEHFHERQNCIQCSRIYCPHYQSEIDSNFCRECLTSASASVITKPLPPDAEGVHHEGKWIMPAGSIYKTLPRAIADMSDVELESYLSLMKTEVKNAETTLQYRRIAVSIGEVESEHRKVLEGRRLRGIRLPKIDGAAIKIGASGEAKPGKIEQITSALKASGITKEMLEALLAAAKAKAVKP